eukprot:TRINITY_DN18589_c0_g1_i2.p1 TRINITY_DN18589_c0_g1~~TRINITY_DN18589_c0_g1_i2.p1  ORF type:complete len:1013 (+),score=314.37 TRINITY_DN18589_c0_g1_i2:54-3092(+)
MPACVVPLLLAAADAPAVASSLGSDGAYSLSVEGERWLAGSDVRYGCGGRRLSLRGGGLTVASAANVSGADAVGRWSGQRVELAAADVPGCGRLVLSVRVYDGGAVAFDQELPDGANGTKLSATYTNGGALLNSGEYPPVVSFPSFAAAAAKAPDLGFLQWRGAMSPLRTRERREDAQGMPGTMGGREGSGPVVISASSKLSVAVGPVTNFKSAVHSRSDAQPAGRWGQLMQLRSAARGDLAACLWRSECWQQNPSYPGTPPPGPPNSGPDPAPPGYDALWCEGVLPDRDELSRAEAGAAEQLLVWFSAELNDTYVGTAAIPPPGGSYGAPSFGGWVYRSRVRENQTQLTVLRGTGAGQNRTITVASAEGRAYAADNGFTALVGVVGWVDACGSGHTQAADPAWETGVSSELLSLPPGFRHTTLVTSGRGPTDAIHRWGDSLRALTDAPPRRVGGGDAFTAGLTYWTDNGGWYNNARWDGRGGGGGAHVTEQDLIGVKTGLARQGLAAVSWQLDDWWYPGHFVFWPVYCVRDWVFGNETTGPTPAKSPPFPDSLGALHGKLGGSLILYAPFFCTDSVWSERYRFLNGSEDGWGWTWSYGAPVGGGPTTFAVPHPADAARFYEELFDAAARVGARGYEVDFMNYDTDAVPLLRTQLGAADEVLSAMAAAASAAGLAVQYCMSQPSDLLAAASLPAVTNYRASGDYAGDPGVPNYDVGGASLLGSALRIHPSKDSFWTARPRSAEVTGAPYNSHANPGSNCELNAVIAALSTGPVGIADKKDETNATLVARVAAGGGAVLLQPDRPATTIDRALLPAALSRAEGLHMPAGGRIWATHSALSGLTWRYVLSINVTAEVEILAADLWPQTADGAGVVVRRWFAGHAPAACADGAAALATGCVTSAPAPNASTLFTVLNDRPVMVENDTHVFDLHTLVPVHRSGWAVLGDPTRYVSASRAVFKYVNFTGTGVVVGVLGAGVETVDVVALQPRAGRSDWTVRRRAAAVRPGVVTAVVF